MISERDYLPKGLHFLHRPRIHNLFKEGVERGLVTVVAPPGYGKTMATSDFVKNIPQKLIWLHYVKLINNMSGFFDNFILAASQELPDFAEKLSHMEFPDTPSKFAEFLRLLKSAVDTYGEIVLAVDDFDFIKSPEVKGFIIDLAEQNIKNFSMIIISGEKLNFSVIKKDGAPFRISEGDLRFTGDEVMSLYASCGKTITIKQAERICSDSEGWPLILYLAATNRSNSAEDSVSRHLCHSSELFEEGYYIHFDKEVQDTLVKMSFFQRFPLDIVCQVSKGDVKKISGDIATNAFIAYDYTTHLFKMQKLYREFLQGKQAFLDTKECEQVLSAAGDWFFKNGYMHDAMDCYWQCHDYAAYMKAVMSFNVGSVSADVTNNILSRLNSIPSEFSEKNPQVDFCKAYMLLNNSQIIEARQIFLKLYEIANSDHPAAGSISAGEICAALSDISLLLNRDDSIDFLKEAAALMPNGSSIRNKKVYTVDNNSVFFLPSSKAGERERMVKLAFEMAKYTEIVSNGYQYGYEWLFSAEAAFYNYELNEAEQCCYQAIYKAQLMEQYDIVCNAYYLLMRICLLRGDAREAFEYVEKAKNYIESNNLSRFFEVRDCTISWFYIQTGALDKVSDWIKEHNIERYTTRPLNIGRNILLCAYYKLNIGENQSANAILLQLDYIFRQKGLFIIKLEKNLIKAACMANMGNKSEAVRYFKEAYDMSYNNGIITPFIEFGIKISGLINQIIEEAMPGFDRDWLLRIQGESSSYARRLTIIGKSQKKSGRNAGASAVKLTARETEILNYLAQGFTRTEISSLLGVSVNTIKKALTRIYTRLGAVNRADAIHIATVRGIISWMDE